MNCDNAVFLWVVGACVDACRSKTTTGFMGASKKELFVPVERKECLGGGKDTLIMLWKKL